jgi:hypothetical protein
MAFVLGIEKNWSAVPQSSQPSNSLVENEKEKYPKSNYLCLNFI